MKDYQLYQQILGLVAPWTVKNVTLKPKEQEVEVEVNCTETVWGCAQCGKRMHVHDWEQRRWRHLDSCQFKTVISCPFWSDHEKWLTGRGFIGCLP